MNITFARPIGAKDKQKRKRSSLLRNVAIGVVGSALLGGAAYLATKGKNKKIVENIINKRDKNKDLIKRRREFLDEELGKSPINEERWSSPYYMDYNLLGYNQEYEYTKKTGKLSSSAKESMDYSREKRATAKKYITQKVKDLREKGLYFSNSYGLSEFSQNKVMFRGKLMTPNKPTKSDNPRKKYMVLAKKGDKMRLIRYGDPKMKDYTQHKNKDRRRSYRARAKGILDKSGKPAYKNFFSPAYWSMRKW